MEIERRTLYNSLRMNWGYDPTIQVEAWQVEDYRKLRLEQIFEKLKEKDIFLDRISFLALAENAQSPEELTDDLLADSDLNALSQDQIYLLIFELWRRFVPEKACLSIFCDELDYQIDLYDRGIAPTAEAIQDALANLQVILDENADEGVQPKEILATINAGCANDIESFLYDFIAEQIDNRNFTYASELLDGFTSYVQDIRWFIFLKARLLAIKDPQEADKLIRNIVDKNNTDPNLELNLEILSILVQGGERDLFVKLVKNTVKNLENEEDFQDLLTISADYYRCLDLEEKENAIQDILKKRSAKSLDGSLKKDDPLISEFLKIAT